MERMNTSDNSKLMNGPPKTVLMTAQFGSLTNQLIAKVAQIRTADVGTFATARIKVTSIWFS